MRAVKTNMQSVYRPFQFWATWPIWKIVYIHCVMGGHPNALLTSFCTQE